MRRFLLVVNKGPSPACQVQPVLEPFRDWDYWELLWHKDSVPHPLSRRAVKPHMFEPSWRKFASFRGTSHPDVFLYDAVCLADDDVEPANCTWEDIFEAFMYTGMRVGTPALTNDSHVSHEITRIRPCAWRETNYLDLMCVLFTKRGLRDHWDTFSAPREPWGIESIWSHRELAAGRAIAILDCAPVKHLRPVNATPERVRQATDDCSALLRQYGVGPVGEHKTLKVHT